MTEEEKKRKKRRAQMSLQLRPRQKNASSPYRGVHLSSKGWLMQIRTPNYNRLVLGPFETEIEAAIAFNRKEVAMFGTPAVLNDIPKRSYRIMGRELGGG
jgi:hypothetical protein